MTKRPPEKKACRLCNTQGLSKQQRAIHKGICPVEANRVGYAKNLLTPMDVLNSLYSLGERMEAIENYCADLKWAIEALGYNPKTHGYPPPSKSSRRKGK